MENNESECKAADSSAAENHAESENQEKITVTMTPQFLYDFMLYHTFSKLSGFLVNIFGMAVGIMGVAMNMSGRTDTKSMFLYLLAAVCVLGYTPLLIKFRSKKYVNEIDDYKYPNEYTFNRKGLHVECNGKVKDYSWDQFESVIATPKNIGFYYGKDKALIIPKEQFCDRFVQIMTIVVENTRPLTVRFAGGR